MKNSTTSPLGRPISEKKILRPLGEMIFLYLFFGWLVNSLDRFEIIHKDAGLVLVFYLTMISAAGIHFIFKNTL